MKPNERPHGPRQRVAVIAAGLLCALAAHVAAQSLYDEKTYQTLASDHKAFRVGDLITVQVIEQSSASTSTDTSTQRTNSVTAGVSTSLASNHQVNGSLSLGGSFDGGGTTQRANKLLATLSVTVREVLPNGDLKVAGEQLLTVNGEQHRVNLQGQIRPQDISTDNLVLSNRLADAHIDYVGDGDLSDRQKRAWWRSVVDWLGL